MSTIKIAMSGLPGRMASAVAEAAEGATDIELLPIAITGVVGLNKTKISGKEITLFGPGEESNFFKTFAEMHGDIIVDYTLPTAVNANAEMFARERVPFVMGTTGGDRERLHQTVVAAKVAAVIAPNMALPIVAITAMLEHVARSFPGVFKDYQLTVRESHQVDKADTSGTAKALIANFQEMGASFDPNRDLELCRDEQKQTKEWMIPQEHLRGHAYHTYLLQAMDGQSSFRLDHNVLGRKIYADGTLHGVRFLANHLKDPLPNRPYHMIDVLQHLESP